MPESAVSANSNVASPLYKSNYFLAEAKFQEEAFFEAQQLFQKLIDTFHKTGLSKRYEKDLKSSNNDAHFISGAYFRLSQLSAKDYPIYSVETSGAADVSRASGSSGNNLISHSIMHKANFNMALYQLDLALTYSTYNKDYLYVKAQLLEKGNDWLGAAKIYKDLCSIDPHSWTFHEKAASAYFEYLHKILSENTLDISGKSKQKNSATIAQSQQEILKEFQIFSDTWEKHFSISPSIIETKLYILGCQEILLKCTSEVVENPLGSTPANFKSKGNTRIQIREQGTPEANAQKRFQSSIAKQNWTEAHQYADILENTLPIFTAHDIVIGFQQLMVNQPQMALGFCENNTIETNPFIQQLYLLLEAKATTQIAISNEKNEDSISLAHASELSNALALWQKLYNQKALTQLNDINEAKSIAILLNNQEWVRQFQQLASDLDLSHPKPDQK